jgi:hypothetical protein
MACLSPILTEWFWQKDDMKEAKPYQDPEFLHQRWVKQRFLLLGGPGYGPGALQKKMDKEMNNVLQRLRADIPYLPEKDFFAYTYFVAGFDNSLVAHLIGLPSPKAASAVKSRLKDEFLRLNSPHKFEYLDLLPAKQLPNSPRNAIFA